MEQMTIKQGCFRRSKGFHVFVLLLMMLISSIVVFGVYIIGRRYLLFVDIGTDTIDSYLPAFANMAHGFQGGEFALWDFNNGMGANYLSGQMTFCDPFGMLIAAGGAIFGIDKLPWLMAAVSVLRVFFAGLSCYAFLSCFQIDVKAKVLTAYVFSFCGFMMLWGQHHFFATALAAMPLLLLALEKSFGDKRFLFLTAALSAGLMMFAVYCGYMILVASACYVLIRFFLYNQKCSVKLFASQVLPMVGAALLGVLISCVIILPTVEIMLNVSVRLANDTPMLERLLNVPAYAPEYYQNVFWRFFSNNLQGVGSYYNHNNSYSNYYEAIQPFFSLLFLLILPQYVINIFRKKNITRVKIAKCAGIGLLAALLFVPAVSMMMNGFVEPVARTAFVALPFFALIMAVTLHDIFREKLLNKPVLLVSAGACFAVLLVQFVRQASFYADAGNPGMGTHMQLFVGILLVSLAMMAVALWIGTSNRAGRLKWGWIILGIAVMVNMTADGFVTYTERANIAKESVPQSFHGGLAQSVDYIKELDDGFYRMERDAVGFSSLQDASVYDYYGISSYNTSLNGNVVEFRRKLWPETDIVPFAVGYTAYAPDSLYNNLLETICGIKYIVTEKTEYDTALYEPVAQFENATILRNKNMKAMGMLFDKVVDTKEFEALPADEQKNLMYQALFTQDATTLLEKSSTTEIPTGDQQTFQNSGDVELSMNPKMTDITAKVDAKTDSILMFSVPYENGWDVYVDGVKAQKLRVDYAFTGVELFAGEHMVEMRYTAPGLYTGLVLTLIGIGILAVWMFFYYRKSVNKVRYSRISGQ